jgi:hypothetical protein
MDVGRLDTLFDAYWCQFEAISKDMNFKHFPEYDWETFLEFKLKTGSIYVYNLYNFKKYEK